MCKFEASAIRIPMQQAKPLLVLNASAGSGKTFNLVRNYLRLLLSNQENRAEMGQIIAMTFTNKAALEMKNRIVSDLNKIIGGDQNHANFRKELAQYIGVDEEMLIKNARFALKKMLHQYEDFHVLTIDKFNLRLIRSFTRDLNLPEQFEIALDESEILEKAVDELLNRIDSNEKNKLYDLCLRYVRSNFDEENRWNIKQALLDSAKILKNEKFFDTIKRMKSFEFDEATREHIRLSLNTLITELNRLRNQFRQALETCDVDVSQVAGKSTTVGRWNHFAQFQSNLEDIHRVHPKLNPFRESLAKNLERFPVQALHDAGMDLANFLEQQTPKIIEYSLKNNYFYLLAILKELAISMDEIRTKEATIRISEFNKLISELVEDQDAPFIYERLGSRFSHFFLDEFQDTSRLQWLNLVPLVHESLSNHKFNFIVGDPKQSIYRFKNGVAEQFVELPGIYNPENSDKLSEKSHFFRQMGQVQGLQENWRSAKEIVQFNNRMFASLHKVLNPHNQRFYEQITQIPRGKDGGLIEFKYDLLEKDADSNRLQQLETWVQNCLDDGYKPSDICILDRFKKNCNLYANHLKQLGYQVVSSDSLLVGSDQYVQLIHRFLKWRHNPKQDQLGMLFAEYYFHLFEAENGFSLYEQCVKTENRRQHFDHDRFFALSGLPTSLITESFPNLFALVQYFLRSTEISELTNAYIHQLLDIIYDFDLKNGPDIQHFLQYLERTGLDVNVQLPENDQAIRIMTAHKSKGLEFPVVIMPSCSFESKRNQKDAIILELNDGLLQTRLSEKESLIPEIKELNEIEKASIETDSLNLMYVAFTRPVDRLYLYDSGEKTSGLTKALIETLLEEAPAGKKETGFHWIIGEKPKIVHDQEIVEQAFHPEAMGDILWFPDISLQSTEEEENERINKQQRIGNQFHYLMESAVNQQEAQARCEQGIRKGIIERENRESLLELTEKAFSDPELQTLLQSGEHLDERTIMISEQERLRPDKLVVSADSVHVIDFKTGEELPKHQKQVQTYCTFLKEIGYTHVKGYLYYAGGSGLIQVN